MLKKSISLKMKISNATRYIETQNTTDMDHGSFLIKYYAGLVAYILLLVVEPNKLKMALIARRQFTRSSEVSHVAQHNTI